ncbi:hypothetical protein CALVIDRAFT_245031 [Calocera viscosa TUFC12733]|uniref:SET domain-containing protein n=1 Tax=Calocera viscosa (strain TUFC12733) TaxID=1330018 RepID=A0A167JH10_CALVF|nr:hypothetical protein CALVIDRAFT_245031 [Calocera viscosa TUFC12733]
MDALDVSSSGAPSIKHLNTHALEIQTTANKGRGVYATYAIPQGTLVEISPVLLFTPDEWEDYGRHTVLDHYTFIWRTPGESKPSMALALGLGSIFNHSSRPNVSFLRQIADQTIEYSTTRDVAAGEELCISYGDPARLWFSVSDDVDALSESDPGEWGGLDGVELDDPFERDHGYPAEGSTGVLAERDQLRMNLSHAQHEITSLNRKGEESAQEIGRLDEEVDGLKHDKGQVEEQVAMLTKELQGERARRVELQSTVAEVHSRSAQLNAVTPDRTGQHAKPTTTIGASAASTSPTDAPVTVSAPTEQMNVVDAAIDEWTEASDEVVPPPELPFERIRSLEELEEEEIDEIKTMNAWVVDIEDPRIISRMLRFLKENALDTPDLGHLRRVRKVNNKAIMLLSTGPPPPLPDLLPTPYLYAVPKLAAKDQDDLRRKNLVWPVEPIMRTQEERKWTRGEVAWIVRGLRRAVAVAQEAGLRGEVPIGTYVCNAPGEEAVEAAGVDTRHSANHPLRHSVMAAIRGIAHIRVLMSSSASTSAPMRISAEASPASSAPVSRSATPSLTSSTKNGADYLLTSLTLFTTHEPCIMCSMALVHSRVKDIFYVQGMPGTGGCGGAEGRGCGVVGKGVNHRFGVWRWTGTALHVPDVAPGLDA